jgi:transcriptional regulator with XRE-family HTH domain
MPTVGERLRALREAHGWNQSELSRRSGVSQGYIWQIENGLRGDNLGLNIIRRLAAALGVTADELAPSGQEASPEDAPEAMAPVAIAS